MDGRASWLNPSEKMVNFFFLQRTKQREDNQRERKKKSLNKINTVFDYFAFGITIIYS